MSLTNFPNGITSFGVPVLGGACGIPFTGKYYFVNYATGADGNDGTPELPMKTVQAAHDRCTSGNNDVVIIIGSGNTTNTQRISTTLTWTKDATHLIGICSPTEISQRARIAPVAATTAFANFMTISGNGCYFANFQLWHGFDTGTTSAICATVSGSRNVFQNVHFAGMGDAASAQNANSRCLKVTGGENQFNSCMIGIDTVTRTVANANIEFASAAARNIFRNCTCTMLTSSATSLFLKTAAVGSIDRFVIFDNCLFINCVGSTSTTLTVGFSVTAGGAGGLFILKNSTIVGATDWADAAGLAAIRIDGAAPTADTSGIALTAT